MTSAGFFARAFCEREFSSQGLATRFVQVNNSLSAKRGRYAACTIRLLPRPRPRSCAASGEHSTTRSSTCGKAHQLLAKSFGAELSAENRRMMYVPKGFAHGFFTLTDDAEAFYFVDEFYAPECERGVRWDDPRFAVAWPGKPTVISEKDGGLRDFDPAWHLTVSV